MSDLSLHEMKERIHLAELCFKANKRIKRLEENNYTKSPAYIFLHGNTHFDPKEVKSKEDLTNEYLRVIRFLNSNTSTIEGCKEYFKMIQDYFDKFDKEALTHLEDVLEGKEGKDLGKYPDFLNDDYDWLHKK